MTVDVAYETCNQNKLKDIKTFHFDFLFVEISLIRFSIGMDNIFGKFTVMPLYLSAFLLFRSVFNCDFETRNTKMWNRCRRSYDLIDGFNVKIINFHQAKQWATLGCHWPHYNYFLSLCDGCHFTPHSITQITWATDNIPFQCASCSNGFILIET